MTTKAQVKGRALVRLLSEVTSLLNLEFETLSAGWVLILTKVIPGGGSKRLMVSGNVFPLNNAAAAALALDKISASEAFRHFKIAHIPHDLICNPSMSYSMGPSLTKGTISLAIEMLAKHPQGLVMKPKDGTAGKGVIHAKSALEIETGWLELLKSGARGFAISPFFRLGDEWRLIILDGKLYSCFRKERASGDWRHNLSHGAIPEIEVDKKLTSKLLPLACSALQCLGLRFASVDIVQLDLDKCSASEKSSADDDGFLVMEVNSAVYVDGFLKHHPDQFSTFVEMFRCATMKYFEELQT